MRKVSQTMLMISKLTKMTSLRTKNKLRKTKRKLPISFQRALKTLKWKSIKMWKISSFSLSLFLQTGLDLNKQVLLSNQTLQTSTCNPLLSQRQCRASVWTLIWLQQTWWASLLAPPRSQKIWWRSRNRRIRLRKTCKASAWTQLYPEWPTRQQLVIYSGSRTTKISLKASRWLWVPVEMEVEGT